MKAIVISEKDWKFLCNGLLTQLKLTNLKHKGQQPTLEELHRAFHYYVVNFMRDVENQ